MLPRLAPILLTGWLLAMATSAAPLPLADVDPAVYGPALAEVTAAGTGPCMAAALAGDRLYVIGKQRLAVYGVQDPRRPVLLGALQDLGNNRQIVVRGNLAYVTAREDGLYIVDVSAPAAPRLVCHYNTIELATGLDVAGPIAYVGCRNYGVELVDISDPAHPQHLGTVRTGEAQSCVARDGLLYAGVWGTRELVVCDISNPRHPTVVSRTPLQGYGDGLCLRGDLCFAATGHHRGRPGAAGEADPAYGMGHALEVLGVHDPRKPTPLARVQLPRLYRLGNDMWSAQVAGDYAYVGDTYNGLFVLDIRDRAHPRAVGHHRLPYVAARQDVSPVGGFAVGHGVIYVAGVYSDLHVIEAPMAQPVTPEPNTPPAIPAATAPQREGWRVYQPAGQVYAAVGSGEEAFVACGAAGLHQVRLWPALERTAVYPTEGFAVDVKLRGSYLYVAEGRGGLSIWEVGAAGSLEPRGRFRVPGKSVKQVVAPAGTSYVLLDVGAATLLVVAAADPDHPREVFRDERLGLLYGYNITDGLFEGRYAACLWHVTGVYWFDLTGHETPVYSGDNLPGPMDSANGLAVLPNGVDGLLTEPTGQYTIVRRNGGRPLAELPHIGLPGHPLGGKPVIAGQTLYLSDRPRGRVTILDISDLPHPRLREEFTIAGNPCLVTEYRGHALLPAGYDGLWVRD